MTHKDLETVKFDKDTMKEKVETLKSKLYVAKEELVHAKEEKSKTAMDELALVVIEVSKENKETKEKLNSTQSYLQDAREEVESLKKVLKNTEDMFHGMLDEVRNERDMLKDEAERLKIEVDLIDIKIKSRNREIMESIALKTRDENCKPRDILKQAINEAENTNLKDELLEKDYILQSLARENDALRIKEAAAHENIKELKRLLNSSASSTLETKTAEEKQHLGEVLKEVQNSNFVLKEHSYSKKLIKFFSSYHKTMDVEEDPEKEEMLKGSIFDVADSPVAPPNHNNHHKTPPLKTPHSRTPSSTFVDDGEMLTLKYLENIDGSQLDDMDGDRNSQRKKKALLRRFGDLIRKTSFHMREPSIG
ncbi:hypothetical protein MKW92_033947 [Papaver armeniacum]|nr:hypothetical protein MKW92_033947 [Papaver armeniacum]